MIGKLFGAGLGWVIGGGPIGAIIGYAIGNMFDKSNKKEIENKGKHRSNPADFSAVLVVASAAVMKADGKILKAELDFVKNFFVKQFGEEIAKEKIILLREVLKQDIPIHEVAHQIKSSMLIAEKRLLLQYLFGIALSDGSIDREELTVIEQLAYGMGISTLEFMRMKAMFVGYTQGQYNSGQQSGGGYRPQQVPLSQYYEVLGVPSSATNDEIKKAYRKLAVQNHPDKVAHLGEEHVKNAQEKFKKIQEAYDAINKSRGVK